MMLLMFQYEREETRRAALKLQEEQRSRLDRQREQQPSNGLVNSTVGSLPNFTEYQQQHQTAVRYSGNSYQCLC
jgi:hypothetical protein